MAKKNIDLGFRGEKRRQDRLSEREMSRKEGWDHIADWYDKLVGQQGHYYHKQVILPKVLSLIKSWKMGSLLDLGCGQGVLARALPKGIVYVGVDISPRLIQEAKERTKQAIKERSLNEKPSSKKPSSKQTAAENFSKSSIFPTPTFAIHDLTQPFELDRKDFDIATLILTLQDLSDPLAAFKNAAFHLKENGKLIVVLNHPCFRIPRQSSWHIDEAQQIQARKINRYLTPLKIPLQTSPGKGERSEMVVHHHLSLTAYSSALQQAGFVIELMEEWISDKESVGKHSKRENRAREEFPLFLCLICSLTQKES